MVFDECLLRERIADDDGVLVIMGLRKMPPFPDAQCHHVVVAAFTILFTKARRRIVFCHVTCTVGKRQM